MSEDLLRKLRMLEEEYPAQPLVAQKADLQEINHLRARLGLPLVDARLTVIGAAEKPGAKPPAAKPKPVPDHAEARAIYEAYLQKTRELESHRAYADQVARATAGPGQTPVRPLATMGTGGGPLLCDHCGKPIILEGGQFHGMTADVAWKKNPREKWMSFILGGMVVEIQSNGTLRIYHGYPGRNHRHCCNIASRKDREAREKFEASHPKCPEKRKLLLAFLEHEFPEMPQNERYHLLSDIIDTLYSYDPGIGVNRPDASGGNS